jgi:tetratricopeptide (TPR) repeat protein
LTSSGPPPGTRRPRRNTVAPVYLVGLGVLALVAIGVVLLLPERVNSPAKPTVSTSEPVPKNPSSDTAPLTQATAPAKLPRRETVETGAPTNALAQQEARRLLAAVLKRQARLEHEGVRIWGDASLRPSYADATGALHKANTLFDKQAHAEASAAFRHAISLFDKLAATKDERFARAINTGTSALENLDGLAAAPRFRIALALRPGDDRARNGLRRAEQAPRVLERMNEARRLEASGNIDTAFSVFRAAEALDSEYVPARENADRLNEIIRHRDYRKSISDALAAIERRKFGQAAKDLESARKIRPAAPEIADIRERIRSGRRLKAIVSLRTQATASERAERWSRAVGFYDKVLAIDPTAGFAVGGRTRAVRAETIYSQVRSYIDNPDRLSSAEPLAHARQVLAVAKGVSWAGPKLRAGLERLGALISAANTPRPVVLKSDGQTNVFVYRVARFGTLSERRLTLRPGPYVAVGSRSGYRDVRVEFRVPPSDEETVVVVRCMERI